METKEARQLPDIVGAMYVGGRLRLYTNPDVLRADFTNVNDWSKVMWLDGCDIIEQPMAKAQDESEEQ